MTKKQPRARYDKPYSGELGRARKPTDPPISNDRMTELLTLLKRQHGIAETDPNWERTLMNALIKTHVPAFREPRKIGRHEKTVKETPISAILELVRKDSLRDNKKTFPRRLASIVSEECARSNLSIASALRKLLTETAIEQGLPPAPYVKARFSKWQRLISVGQKAPKPRK
jgi:hypothetical protein